MKLEALLKDIPPLLTAIATLLWPVIVLVAIVAARPLIKWVFKQDKNVTVKVGGVEISIQQAVEDARRTLEDVTAKVNELRGSEPVEVTPPPRAVPRQARLLWVDDRPAANAFERASAEDQGWRVTFAQSTSEALATLHRRGPFDLIVSDIGREEAGRLNHRAGIDLVNALRTSKDATPVIFYSSPRSISNVRDDLTGLSGVVATTSPSDLAYLLATHQA